jgi:peroxiredoxin Q/BCP
VAYFGISIDRPETNRRFAESLGLDFPVLSDPSRETARAYGVLRGFGLFTARHTFYIGADGVLLAVDRRVRPPTAGQDMVERIETLAATGPEGE